MSLHRILKQRLLLTLIAVAALSGCSNMSGIGGTSEFNCKAPVGVPCRSVSAVDHAVRSGQLEQMPEAVKPTPSGFRAGSASADEAMPAYKAGTARQVSMRATMDDEDVNLGAIRSEPTIIRIWVAPYEDSDGDLHEASRVYLQIDSGRWLIERNQQRIRTQFAPTAARAAAATPGGTLPPFTASSTPLPAARMAQFDAPAKGAPSAAAAAPAPASPSASTNEARGN